MNKATLLFGRSDLTGPPSPTPRASLAVSAVVVVVAAASATPHAHAQAPWRADAASHADEAADASRPAGPDAEIYEPWEVPDFAWTWSEADRWADWEPAEAGPTPTAARTAPGADGAQLESRTATSRAWRTSSGRRVVTVSASPSSRRLADGGLGALSTEVVPTGGAEEPFSAPDHAVPMRFPAAVGAPDTAITLQLAQAELRIGQAMGALAGQGPALLATVDGGDGLDGLRYAGDVAVHDLAVHGAGLLHAIRFGAGPGASAAVSQQLTMTHGLSAKTADGALVITDGGAVVARATARAHTRDGGVVALPLVLEVSRGPVTLTAAIGRHAPADAVTAVVVSWHLGDAAAQPLSGGFAGSATPWVRFNLSPLGADGFTGATLAMPGLSALGQGGLRFATSSDALDSDEEALDGTEGASDDGPVASPWFAADDDDDDALGLPDEAAGGALSAAARAGATGSGKAAAFLGLSRSATAADPLAEAKALASSVTAAAAGEVGFPWKDDFDFPVGSGADGDCVGGESCFGADWEWVCEVDGAAVAETDPEADYCWAKKEGAAFLEWAPEGVYVDATLISPYVDVEAVKDARTVRWASQWFVLDFFGTGGVTLDYEWRVRFSNGTHGAWTVFHPDLAYNDVDDFALTESHNFADPVQTNPRRSLFPFEPGVLPGAVEALQFRWRVRGETFAIDQIRLYEAWAVECPGTYAAVDYCDELPAGTCGTGSCDDSAALCELDQAGPDHPGCSFYFRDADADGYGHPSLTQCLCAPEGLYDATNNQDCDDTDEDVNPGATEVCDSKDNNCRFGVDEGFLLGVACDGDDADLCTDGLTACAADGLSSICADGTDDPEHVESCNDLDDDCDGATDEEFPLVGTPCDGDDPDLCEDGVLRCAADGSGLECRAEGAVAFFAADEGGGSQVHDVATGLANGTRVNATWDNGAAGGRGSLSFDGNGDYVEFPTAGLSNKEGSIAFWMRPDWAPNGATQRGQFQTQSGVNSSNWVSLFQWSTGNAYTFRLGSGAAVNGCCTNDLVVSTTGLYTPLDWVHVAATWSEATDRMTLSLFNPRTGVTRSQARSAVDWSGGAISALGRFGVGHDRFHDGLLDEMGAWDYALSSAEIDALRATGYPASQRNLDLCDGLDNDCSGSVDDGYTVGAACDGADADSCVEGVQRCAPSGIGTRCGDGPVAYWTFDNDSDATITDETGGGHTLTLFNEIYSSGVLGGAGLYKNAGTQTMSTPHAADLNLDHFTIAAWMRPTQYVGDWVRLVGKGDEAAQNFGLWRHPDGRLMCRFVAGDGTGELASCWNQPGAVAPSNAWTHAACTYDGRSMRLYVNGIERATCAETRRPIDSGVKLELGGSQYVNRRFIGEIDDVGLWDYAISDAEVATLATTGLPAASRNIEYCDGADNDCSGAADEGYTLGVPCDGPDGDSCFEGVRACDGLYGTVCTDTTGTTEEVCDGADNDCDGATDEDVAGTGAACELGFGGDGLCNIGTLTCTSTGLTCVPAIPGYGAVGTQPVPAGLLVRETAAPGAGAKLVTTDGRYVYSLSFACGAVGAAPVANAGWTYRVIDPLQGWTLVEEVRTCVNDSDATGADDVSFFVDGVVSDGQYLYPIGWTGDVGKVVRIALADGSVQDLGHSVPQATPSPSLANGQWDSVNQRMWLGSLSSGAVAGWDAPMGWEPTAADSASGDWDVASTTLPVAGAGVLASDGTYLYVRRWGTFAGSGRLKRLGTGFGGTTLGADEGWVTTGELGQSVAGFVLGGVFYHAVNASDGSAFETVRVSGLELETCNQLDDDCDGSIDESFIELGQPCDGPDGDACTEGVFACAANGLGTVCGDITNTKFEICNGLDDDCDGVVDEGFADLGDSCGSGACGGGLLECSADGSAVICSTDEGGSNAQATEELCDALDNDCDGQTDEGFDVGLPCDGTDPDQCLDGRRVCRPDGLGTICGDGATWASGFDKGVFVDAGEVRDLARPGGAPAVLSGVGEGTSFVPGASGDAVAFTGGTTSTYLRVPTAAWDFGGYGWTLAMFFLPFDVANNVFVSLATPEGADGLTLAADGGLWIRNVDYGTAPGRVLGPGQWVHVAVTFDPIDGMLRVYKDAVQVSENYVGTKQFGFVSDLWLGQELASAAGGGFDPAQATRGAYDSVILVNRPMLPAELDALRAEPYIPSLYRNNEICDGFDNDCDGTVDDGFLSLGVMCDGEDLDLCEEGVIECHPQGWDEICADYTSDSVEICNGSDDDCDGDADEGFGVGVPCETDDADLCIEGATRCSLDGEGVVCAAGPKVAYIFDEGPDGGVVLDWAGDGFDEATPFGSPTYAPGHDSAFGLAFDGVDDALIETVTGYGTESFTLGMWVNPARHGDQNGFLPARLTFHAAVGTYVDLNQDGTVRCAYRFADGSGVGGVTSPAGVTLPLNSWTHVACAFDADSGSLRLIVGGDTIAQQTYTQGVAIAATAALRIGAGYTGPLRYRYEGVLDDWALYDYALTDIEVQQEMFGLEHLNREVCDGADNDCGGTADDAWPTVGELCDGTDADTCEGGEVICDPANPMALTCSDSPGPSVELCGDGIDNDCDGETDEGFDAIGSPCDGTDADQCADGFVVCADDGALACDDDAASVAEACNGLDDDCDGDSDEDFATLGDACDGADADLCADGVVVCAADTSGTECSDATDDPEQLEACNGFDDDCDGELDEGFDLGAACEEGDADRCFDGAVVCDGAGGTTCGPGATAAFDFDLGVDSTLLYDLADADGSNDGLLREGLLVPGVDTTRLAARFPGGSDSQGLLIPSAGFNGAGWSLSLWLRVDQPGVNDAIVSMSGAASGPDSLRVSTNGTLVVRGVPIPGVFSLLPGEWNHLEITHDALNGLVTARQNGSVTFQSDFGADSLQWNSPLFVAQRTLCPAGCFDAKFAPAITVDELVWLNRALSSDELDELINAGRIPEGHLGREFCDGEDNDCDGDADQPFVDVGSFCDGPDLDLCLEGTRVCDALGLGTVCTDTTATNEELCNTFDDDCDGDVDEAFPLLDVACDGNDLDLCPEGVFTCAPDQLGVVCDDLTGTNPETCNALDDDCDGLIDEDIPAVGTPCDDGDADLCITDSRTICDPTSGGVVCGASAGPVYTFEPGTGVDVSGEGDDAAVVGTSLIDDGLQGRALRFPGGDIGHYVRVPEAAVDSAQFTWSFWVRPTGLSASNARQVFSRHTAADDDGLRVAEGGRLYVGGQSVFNGTVGAPGVWHHVVLLGDGQDITYYVNGVVRWSGTSGLPLDWDADAVFGQDQDVPNGGFVANQAFQGDLDEVAYWPRVLQAADLATLYTGRRVPAAQVNLELCDYIDNDCNNAADDLYPDLGAACDGDDADQCADGSLACSADMLGTSCENTGPALFYALDEGVGTSAYESAYGGKAGVLQGTAAWGSDSGRTGVQLDGIAGEVVIDKEPAAQMVGPMTIEARVRLDALPPINRPFGAIVAKGDVSRNYALFVTALGTLHFSATAASGATCSTFDLAAVPVGVWTHLAVVVRGDAGSQTHTYYIDGVGTSTGVPPGACGLPLTPNKDPLVIGGLGTSRIQGLVAEVAVHDRWLTAAEVALQATAGMQPEDLSAERCDGLDNDCDGVADDVWPQVDFPCDGADLNTCTDGVFACGPTGWDTTCVEDGAPKVDLCNGEDEDCDGAVDEDFALGVACGLGACAGGVTECSADQAATVCSSGPGGSSDKSTPELCDGIDNDCDGLTDEDFALGDPCGVGLCLGGVRVCSADQAAAVCSTDGNAVAETCNGVDDDCDGVVDDSPSDADAVCSTGTGGLCDPGVTVCSSEGVATFDFDDGSTLGWKQFGSTSVTWSADSGDLTALGGAGLSGFVTADPQAEGAAVIEAVISTDDTGRFGVVWGFNDASDFQFLLLNTGNTAVGNEQVTASWGPSSNDFDFGLGDRIRVRVEVGVAPFGRVTLENLTAGTGEFVLIGAGLVPEGSAVGAGFMVNASDDATFESLSLDGKGVLRCVSTSPGVPETCNGLDDDCDTFVDEDFALGLPCDGPDADQCATGLLACAADGSGATECIGETRPDQFEICDGFDNDCDGETDEDVGGEGAPCGTGADGVCGTGVTECVPSIGGHAFDSPAELSTWFELGTGSSDWQVSGGQLVQTGNFPDQLFATPVPTATGVFMIQGDLTMNDDDGASIAWYISSTGSAGYNHAGINLGNSIASGDEEFRFRSGGEQSLPVPFAISVGDTVRLRILVEGAQFTLWAQNLTTGTDLVHAVTATGDAATATNRVGFMTFWMSDTRVDDFIVATGGLACAGVVGPTPEVCDGLDNNCDGQTDEAFAELGAACDSDDSDLCALGTYTCRADGSGTECVNEPTVDIAEVCDTIDNDCDGAVDEDYPTLGQACDGPDPDSCATGTIVCNPLGGAPICEETGTPIVEVCDGLDNDCDGETDESFPGEGAPCALGYGASAELCATGTQACRGGVEMCEPIMSDGPAFGFAETVFIEEGLLGWTSGAVDGTFKHVTTDGRYVYNVSATAFAVAGAGWTVRVFDPLVGFALIDEITITGPSWPASGVVADGQHLYAIQASTPMAMVAKLDLEAETVEQGAWQVPQGYPSPSFVGGQFDPDSGTMWLGSALSDLVGAWDASAGWAPVALDDSLGNWDSVANVSVPGVSTGVLGTDGVYLYVAAYGAATSPSGVLRVGTGFGGTVAGESYGQVTTWSVPDSMTGFYLGGWMYFGGKDENTLTRVRVNDLGIELCDGVDQDCDGVADDVYARLGLGADCDGGDADLCDEGVWACSDDGLGLTCDDLTDDTLELCNGGDDDCDGQTDEDYEVLGDSCGVGVCAGGTYECALDGSAAVCSTMPGAPGSLATAESCNSVDDNCDGDTDEAFPLAGKPCDGPDADTCATGTWTCTGDGAGVECLDDDGDTGPEVCDGFDNDCDGQTDEDWSIGAPCGSGACFGGQIECRADGTGSQCSTELGGSNQLAVAELCNGVDDDCDGETDEGFNVGASCGEGVCVGGTVVCSPDGTTALCSTMPGGINDKSAPDVCDGFDNDCDGESDEDYPTLGDPCDGLDTDLCAEGLIVCGADGLSVTCTDTSGNSLESCNSIDDDCDGDTDEDFPLAGSPCDGPDADQCANGAWACDADGTDVVCLAESVTNIPEACNGVDDDCDGETDEGFTYTYKGITRKVGQSCDGVGLCGIGVVECGGPLDATCSTNPGGSADGSEPELCDGLDNDCDDIADDGVNYKGLPLGALCDGEGTCGAGFVECVDLQAICSTEKNGADDETSVEMCDGLDNDCDGDVDETFVYVNAATGETTGVGQLCNGVGLCGPGIVECLSPMVATCSSNPDGTSPGVNPEECNGQDDDCDGELDEASTGLPLSENCYSGPPSTEGVGACFGGVRVCIGGQYGACGGEVLPANADLACDGVDEDCDGQTDEEYETVTCGTGACLAVSACVDGVEDVCTPGTPTSDANCDGVDDDCDGETDEDYVPTTCGVGVCGATSVCAPGGFEVPCQPGSPTLLVEELNCDGLDNDCDGTTDEDYDDGLACTASACVDGVATNTPVNAACDDGEPCTDDVCLAGQGCVSVADSTNTPDPASADTNPCTSLVCKSGVSQNVPDDLGIPDDGIACTYDYCVDGLAQHDVALGFCLIDGVDCYASGDLDPSDSCGVCFPPESNTEFTTTVFREDFDGVLVTEWVFDDYEGSGIGWQLDSGDAFSSPSSLYMGNPVTRTYDAGSNRVHSAATTLTALPIPPDVVTTLEFRIDIDTENYTASVLYDVLYVEIVDAVGVATTIWNSTEGVNADTGGDFRLVRIDVSAFAGQKVFLRFRFDSADEWYNDYEGVYIDDVLLRTQCCTTSADCDDGDDTCTIDTCGDDGLCNYTHLCDGCAPSTANMLVLLDFSGSMDDPSSAGSPVSKWDAATGALVDTLELFGPVLNTGIKLFSTPELDSCSVDDDLELPFPAGHLDVGGLLAPLNPSGSTPMTAGLYAAGNAYADYDFPGTEYVLVITDGQDTCAADPVNDPPMAVQSLADQGIETYVLGFGTGIDHGVLNAMAFAGGNPQEISTAADPAYYLATNAQEFQQAILDIFGDAAGEVCNGIDDDCDGDTDEGVAPLACNVQCGALGIAGKRYCINGEYSDCTVNPEAEVCNGLDDDCNGVADDPWTDDDGAKIGDPCTVGSGACAATGVYECNPDGFGEPICNATPGGPAPEVCDNVDNDCDGEVDEDLDRVCETNCGTGTEVCISGDWYSCTAPPELPDDQCDDVDNDCDGVTDPGFPDIGLPCDGPDLDLCTNGTVVCTADGLGTECGPEFPTDLVEICGGGDENCDGLADETDAVGCTDYYFDGDEDTWGVGDPLCLCGPNIANGYTATKNGDCLDSNPNAFPGNPELCDDVDNDCDALTDEDPFDAALLQTPCYDPPDGDTATEGVGACSAGTSFCVNGTYGACIDAIYPKQELCNGLDDDCDGSNDNEAVGNSVDNPDHPCADVPNCSVGQCICLENPVTGDWSCTID